MSPKSKEEMANLGFFVSAVLEPAIGRFNHFRAITAVDEDNPYQSQAGEKTMAAFGALETSLWLKVGADIGYFDGDAALEVLTSASSVLDAWSYLVGREVLSPHDSWCNFISLRNRATLDARKFLGPPERPFVHPELLHTLLQAYLLLAAECMIDDDAFYFLSSVAWTRDEVWSIRKLGRSHDGNYLVSQEFLCAGVSSVMLYLEECANLNDLTASFLRESSVGTLKRAISSGDVSSLNLTIRRISGRQLNFYHPGVTERYVEFAAELVAQSKLDRSEEHTSEL